MKTGLRIKKVRQLLKKSQQDLADELNVTKQAISNIETGKCSCGINLLSKLLVDYNVNMNYIIGGYGSVFITDDKSAEAIKKSVIEDVLRLLDERGIVSKQNVRQQNK